MKTTKEPISFTQEALAAAADPATAPQMAAYMKTDMPSYGVKKPGRVPVVRAIKQQFRPASRRAYAAAVRGLWRLPHREETYLSLAAARMFRDYIDSESMPQILQDGARAGARVRR